MKKSFFDFAGTLFRTSIYAVCCLSLIGLSSCSSDDDDDDEGNGGGKPSTELVSTTIPTAGWSGSTDNGTCTYRSDDQEEEYSAYYAFAFENGKCTDAVYNVVCENEAMAKELSQMLNSGQWIYDDDDDDDYSVASLAKSKSQALVQTLRNSKAFMAITRSAREAGPNVMGITCTRDGRIVYFKVNALKGLDGESVKYAVQTWDTGLNMNNLPEKPVFGTWNEATGKYTSNSIYAIPGTKIEIETAFNSSDITTKYVAKFTMPNEFWAEMIEESLREQADGYRQLFGIELEISRTGSVVTSEHVNVGTSNATKEDLVKMIIAMDILNAQPIGTLLF